MQKRKVIGYSQNIFVTITPVDLQEGHYYRSQDIFF